MNGAEGLIRTLATAGVEVCFANPGTTELHLVQALDDADVIRAVPGLFEGVCSAAADGYARMAGRPAMTLLHLGPGVANALANLHNARRARTPVVNVVGEHVLAHRGHGAPLDADIESLVGPVSKWVRTSATTRDLAPDGAAAVAAASSAPGGVATLIVPADCAWDEGEGPVAPQATVAPAAVSDDVVEAARAALAADRPAALLLGGAALSERGLRAAGRVAAATGCSLFAETFPARMERGGDLPAPQRLPYFPQEATAALGGSSSLVLAGAPAPVAFFGYPGLPSELAPPGMPVFVLAAPEHDVAGALERLADSLGVADGAHGPIALWPPTARRPFDPVAVAQVLAANQPEGAIVVDESVTLSAHYVAASAGAPRHSYLALTGGAIGQGLPSAAGAAIACPDRPVIALQADGSAMYTLQALWTHAREGLDVTSLICSNGSYRILLEELSRAGVKEPGPRARASADGSRSNDPLSARDWVALAAEPGPQLVRWCCRGSLPDARRPGDCGW